MCRVYNTLIKQLKDYKMTTLKLLTITALVGTLSMTTLNANSQHQDRVHDKKSASEYQTRDTKKSPKVKNYKKKSEHVKDKKAQGKKHAVKSLKRGDRGIHVKALQRALKKERLYRGPIDGIFRKNVEKAVKKFQKEQRLYADGKVGTKTLRALRLR
ncbi:MAG: Unknown protein [uncultured Sulfurovum sp.]|uniref:Peptidoglycan binding-like domain-containing protein n=1 Tax=uncultured Sulfurovum sp. TaxID=269237 RepID=A0A6S6T3C0_9BACT|nr:MAG: Unknown protein [uncultured Sulfurovum sp.]